MGILDNFFNFTAASGGGQNPSTPSPAEAPSSVIDLVRQAARQQVETATKNNPAPAATIPLADDRGRGRTSYARQAALERKGGGELARLVSPLSQLDETQQAADRKAAAEEKYNAAQKAYDEARADFTRMTAAGIATPTDFSDAQNRVNEAKTALDDAKKAYEDAGGNDPSFLDRLLGTVKGGLKGSLANTTDAQRALYEAGQTGRSRANQEEIDYWTRAVEQNQRIYDKTLAMHGGDVNNGDVEAARNLLEDAQRKLSAYQTVEAAQPGASAAAAELADVIQQSSAKDLARAKENGSGLEKFLVDAGASGVQMLGDAAAGAVTGVGMLPAMAFRSFGGGTQEARQAGADIWEQLGFGAANAAVEVITEQMADGLAGLAGKGAADDVAEEVIRRLASTDEGRTALRALYGMGGEAVEEVVSSVVNPAIKAIYDEGEAAKESYGTGEGRKQLLVDTAYDALVGAALGGVGTAASLVNGQNAEANRELTARDAGTTAEGQLLNALNVAEGRMSLEDQLAREQAARQRLATGNPVLDMIRTGAVQNAAEMAPAATGTVTHEITPAEAPVAETAPAAALNTEATPEARQAEIQARLDEIENELNTETDENAIADLYAEGDALLKESQALENQIRARDTQRARIDAGEVSKGFGTAENHIDNRTDADMRKPGVKAFQFDHPELHGYFVDAAQALIEEVQAADMQTDLKAGQKGSAVKRGPVRALMDAKLSKPRILQCLNDIIQNNGQENYADAKRVEKVLSDMMSEGWTDMGRNIHEANADYVAAKEAIQGAVQSDSWEKYLADREWMIETGDATEAQLRAEWEAQQRSSAPSQQNIDRDGLLEQQRTASAPTGTNTDDGPNAPPPGGGGPTLTPTDTTTAESTNGTGNERERGGSANIRTNENAEADLRQSFENAPEMYRQMTNAEVQAKADAIMAKGFDAARSEVEQAVGQAKAGMKLKPEHLVAGFEVANEMTRRGDVDAANRLMADLFAEQTAGGQLGQLGRLLRAQAPATKAQVVQNLVDKMNNALNKAQLRKNMRRGVGDTEGRIFVDSALVEQFANATDEAASNAALDAIQRNIASQIPATISEKFTALRYLNMLGNLKTQGRNIVGNTAMMATTDIKRTVQAVNELVVSAVSGGKYKRNTSLFTSKELRQQAAADFEANINEIKGESKYSEASKKALQGVQDYRTIFGSGENAFTLNIGGKDIEVRKNILENARRLTNWAMDAGDVIFMRHTYIQAFAGWMKAHGVSDVSSATQEQVQKARAFAAKEAQEATFHDNNAVSDWVSGIGRGENAPSWVNTLAEGIMPFRKTPANVAVRAIEYSPVGVAETIYKGVQAAKGKATAADVINSASKSATGTALAAAGYFLAAAGMARGSGDDEDDELNSFQKMQGASDYSVKIGDSYVSLSQFAPMAIPFFMGVKLQELIENSDEPLSLDSAGDILGIISDPMLEMSMLSGVNDTLSNVASLSGDTDAIPSLVANAAIGYLSQGLTNSLLGQAEQAWEKNRQTSYTDTKSADATEIDKFLAKGQYKLGQLAAKTPGIDYHQQDYVDAWGRTRDNGSAGERLFNAFLNPTYVTDDSSTDVDAELERLHRDNKDVEGFPEVLPKKRARSATIGNGIVMTPDEYLQFSKDSGQMKLSLVRDFMGSQQYKSMSDAERAKTISDLYAFADDRSLQKVKVSYGVNTASDWDDEAQLSNVPEYLAAKSVFTSKTPDYRRIDNLISDWDKLSADTQDKLSTLTGMNGVRFSLDELGLGSKQYNQIKADITKYEKDGLDGETKAAADAAVIAKHFKGTDEEKIKALESQNLPDKKTGKRASIVRRFEAANEQGISFDQWSQVEAYIQDHAKSTGSPSNAVLYDAAAAVGLKSWQTKWVWRTYSSDEKVVDVYNDYFSKDYVAPERVNYGEYLSSEEPQANSRDTGREASLFLTESELAKLLGITS